MWVLDIDRESNRQIVRRIAGNFSHSKCMVSDSQIGIPSDMNTETVKMGCLAFATQPPGG